MRELTTADQVFEELGGVTSVSNLLNCSVTRVSNWKVAGKFPSKMFVAMQSALHERSLTAPPSLWGMASQTENAA